MWISATRLPTNFAAKVHKIFDNFLGYYKKHYFLSKNCCGSFLGNLWKLWKTFYFYIWSHCCGSSFWPQDHVSSISVLTKHEEARPKARIKPALPRSKRWMREKSCTNVSTLVASPVPNYWTKSWLTFCVKAEISRIWAPDLSGKGSKIKSICI